jgi:hypothetical protein
MSIIPPFLCKNTDIGFSQNGRISTRHPEQKSASAAGCTFVHVCDASLWVMPLTWWLREIPGLLCDYSSTTGASGAFLRTEAMPFSQAALVV